VSSLELESSLLSGAFAFFFWAGASFLTGGFLSSELSESLLLDCYFTGSLILYVCFLTGLSSDESESELESFFGFGAGASTAYGFFTSFSTGSSTGSGGVGSTSSSLKLPSFLGALGELGFLDFLPFFFFFLGTSESEESL
jgi:hypothetical protein